MKSTPLYVVVTGGRNLADRELVFSQLDARRITLLFHGGATGADRLAADWCEERGVPTIQMRAPWKKLGQAAGPTRNRWLVEIATTLATARGAHLEGLAFPGAAGTADCVRRMEAAGVPVTTVGVAPKESP